MPLVEFISGYIFQKWRRPNKSTRREKQLHLQIFLKGISLRSSFVFSKYFLCSFITTAYVWTDYKPVSFVECYIIPEPA